MEQLGLFLGTLIGAILKQITPILVDILSQGIKRAITPTAEDSKRNEDLEKNLLSQLPPKR